MSFGYSMAFFRCSGTNYYFIAFKGTKAYLWMRSEMEKC